MIVSILGYTGEYGNSRVPLGPIPCSESTLPSPDKRNIEVLICHSLSVRRQMSQKLITGQDRYEEYSIRSQPGFSGAPGFRWALRCPASPPPEVLDCFNHGTYDVLGGVETYDAKRTIQSAYAVKLA